MLRWIVALLLAANLAWLAWAQGWLRPIGFGPQRQGEPERVADYEIGRASCRERV